MRRINSNIITEEVKRLCLEGNTILGDDVIKSFEENLTKEESHLGRDILKILIKNTYIAKEKSIPFVKIREWQCFLWKWDRML